MTPDFAGQDKAIRHAKMTEVATGRPRFAAVLPATARRLTDQQGRERVGSLIPIALAGAFVLVIAVAQRVRKS